MKIINLIIGICIAILLISPTWAQYGKILGGVELTVKDEKGDKIPNMPWGKLYSKIKLYEPKKYTDDSPDATVTDPTPDFCYDEWNGYDSQSTYLFDGATGSGQCRGNINKIEFLSRGQAPTFTLIVPKANTVARKDAIICSAEIVIIQRKDGSFEPKATAVQSQNCIPQ